MLRGDIPAIRAVEQGARLQCGKPRPAGDSGWRDWLDIPDLKQPRVHAYAVAATEHRKALAAWEREAARLRLVQWPRAWAEAVLETLP